MYDPKDERGIPVSAGIPPLVVIASLVGVVIIFTIGTLVVTNSAYGHAWPASRSISLPL